MFGSVGSTGNLASFLIGGAANAPADAPGAGEGLEGAPCNGHDGRDSFSHPPGPVSVTLVVETMRPKPRTLELCRQTNSGTTTLPNVLYDALRGFRLECVRELALREGTARLLSDMKTSWAGLTRLDLSDGGLVTVPEEVFDQPQIRELVLDNNRLTSLPSLVKLPNLRVLSANDNQIRELRADLRECAHLRVISLEGNRLTKPVIDMKALSKVHTLRSSTTRDSSTSRSYTTPSTSAISPCSTCASTPPETTTASRFPRTRRRPPSPPLSARRLCQIRKGVRRVFLSRLPR